MILKKSCFCYSLRHGAVVIGISVVVSSAVSLLALIGMIAEWKDIRESFKDERMRELVYPMLIISSVLSSVYMIFSLLMLKGVKEENKSYIIPWLCLSIIYILIAAGCCIYELTLGGTIIELTVPPVIYVIILTSWMYALMCVFAHFNTMTHMKKRKKHESTEIEEQLLALRGSRKYRFPKPVWEYDSSSSPNLQESRNVKSVRLDPNASSLP